MAYPSTLLESTEVIRKTANPMMSTYSLEVPAVAMSRRIGTWRVTVWPARFVPVARIVSWYSPGPRVPPLMETATAWLPFLLSVKDEGVSDADPIPEGSAPFRSGPPSSVSETVPPK